MKACSAHLVLEEHRARRAVDRRGVGQRGAAREAGRVRDGRRAAGRAAHRGRVPRQRARGACARSACCRTSARPGSSRELVAAGYRGPIGLRVNPGFGHGHVQACDTGGPSSKHGVWIDDVERRGRRGARGGPPGGAPARARRQRTADRRAVREPAAPGATARRPRCRTFPTSTRGEPRWRHPVLATASPSRSRISAPLARILIESRELFSAARRTRRPRRDRAGPLLRRAGGDVGRARQRRQADAQQREGRRAELHHGRRRVLRPGAPGDVRLVPSHRGARATSSVRWRRFAVAGPLCESGDVFTRDAGELIEPRELPTPRAGRLRPAARRRRLRRGDELELQLARPRAAGVVGRRRAPS